MIRIPPRGAASGRSIAGFGGERREGMGGEPGERLRESERRDMAKELERDVKASSRAAQGLDGRGDARSRWLGLGQDLPSPSSALEALTAMRSTGKADARAICAGRGKIEAMQRAVTGGCEKCTVMLSPSRM